MLVRNTSWENHEDDEYLVNVVAGVRDACERPADRTDNGAWKHRGALAIRGPVLEAAK